MSSIIFSTAFACIKGGRGIGKRDFFFLRSLRSKRQWDFEKKKIGTENEEEEEDWNRGKGEGLKLKTPVRKKKK